MEQVRGHRSSEWMLYSAVANNLPPFCGSHPTRQWDAPTTRAGTTRLPSPHKDSRAAELGWSHGKDRTPGQERSLADRLHCSTLAATLAFTRESSLLPSATRERARAIFAGKRRTTPSARDAPHTVGVTRAYVARNDTRRTAALCPLVGGFCC